MSSVETALASLDAVQRDALLVLTLDCEYPLSRSRWQDRARDAGLVTLDGRKLYGPEFQVLVGQLVVARAVEESRSGYTTEPGWTTAIVEDGQRRGRLAAIAGGLRQAGRLYGQYLTPRGLLLAGLGTDDRTMVEEAVTAFRLREARGAGTSLTETLGFEIPEAWLAAFSAPTREDYVRFAIQLAFLRARRIGPAVEEAALASTDDQVRAHLAMLFALRGEPARATTVLDGSGGTVWVRGARGFVALTEGKLDEARSLFAAAATGARGQRLDPPGVHGVLDLLLAVTSDDAAETGDFERRLQKGRTTFAIFPYAADALRDMDVFRRTGQRRPRGMSTGTWLDVIVYALTGIWMGDEPSAHKVLAMRGTAARDDGYAWLAAESARILAGDRAASLLALSGSKEPWELALDSLKLALGSAEAPGASTAVAKAKRVTELWWTITVGPSARWVDLDAHLVGRPGTKGTKLSMRRMLDPVEPVGTEQDRRIATAIERARDPHHSLPLSVVLPLVGHPRVRDAAGQHYVIEAREPSLHVERTATGVVVRLLPDGFDESGVALVLVGTMIAVYTRTPLSGRILAAIPPGGIRVPEAGLARLSEVLGGGAAGIAVEAAQEIASETIAGAPRIHVQIFRAVGALRVRIRVVPGGATGPALRPGVPPAETMIHGEAGLVRVVRDLAAERERAERLLERCPILASLPQDGADSVTRDLETSLELLVELHDAAGDPALDIVIDWPEGQPLRPPVVRNASHVSMRVKGDSAWLTVEGEIRVDESRVVAMRDLVAGASRAQGRFVPIGEDEYVALTDSLRKKLDALARMQRLSKDGRIPGALLSGMEGIWDGIDIQFTDAVEKRRDALESARHLEMKVPRGLEAELRDYQRDGFLFLARRTEAGLGACLADDMGLGKTVQAIALLLHRRKKGPSLVVAPTSVRRNWETELGRFAPSLTVVRFGEGDRTEQIAAAGAGHVVLVSYGLLAAAQELLAGANQVWGTVVFDEAHALKNASTHRWAAARALKSEAVVALTGTPVENHAGELHALFDLLLPGMLGVRATFDRALGASIAEGDREAASLLRQIVRPFVLRRTKAEVLTELPPKTELVQIVPASPAHLAYYEAIRRTALEKIESARKVGGAKAAHARLDILAEITRLRRAAVDPRLVGGDDAPPGGKIDALFELVTELKAEGRRALVFSQFLGALDLARAKLEEGGIECLRLDGSMSETARADEVAAFQAGRGDVFLVSLKAGGVGMNLTAADFVVFLDPWWNPAVEDQATGRAHRMGQERPVTVARLVTEQTIEEKVLALHDRKRKLYEDIVSEADGTGTLSVDAIGELLGA